TRAGTFGGDGFESGVRGIQSPCPHRVSWLVADDEYVAAVGKPGPAQDLIEALQRDPLRRTGTGRREHECVQIRELFGEDLRAVRRDDASTAVDDSYGGLA